MRLYNLSILCLGLVKAITKIVLTRGRYALRTGCHVCAICCISCLFVECR